MKRHFIFCFLLTSATILLAKNDLVERIKQLLETNRDTALVVVNNLLEADEETNYDKSYLLNVRGNLVKKTALEDAYWDYMESLRLLKLSGIENHQRESGLLINIGGIYHKFSDYDKALSYYRDAEKIVHEGYRKNLLYNIALALSKKGDDVESFKTLMDARKYCGDDWDQIAKIHSKMGTIAADGGQFEKSISYQYRVINDSANIRSYNLGKAYHNLAVAYTLKGDTAKAISSLKRSIEIKKDRRKFLSLQDLSELYMQTGQYDLSIKTGMIAESYYNQVDEIPVNIAIFQVVAEAYYGMGDAENYREYMLKFSSATDRFNHNKRNVTDQHDQNFITLLSDKYEAMLRQQNQNILNERIIGICLSGIGILLLILLGIKLSQKKIRRDIEKELIKLKIVS